MAEGLVDMDLRPTVALYADKNMALTSSSLALRSGMGGRLQREKLLNSSAKLKLDQDCCLFTLVFKNTKCFKRKPRKRCSLALPSETSSGVIDKLSVC